MEDINSIHQYGSHYISPLLIWYMVAYLEVGACPGNYGTIVLGKERLT